MKCDKVVCVCVSVCEERRREAEEKEPGIQNQKQEPNTKLWGTIKHVRKQTYQNRQASH